MPRVLSVHAVKGLARLRDAATEGRTNASLKLRQWLLEHHLTVNQFALMTTINRKVMDSILRGGWTAKAGYIALYQAFAIEWATQGHVAAWEWLDDPFIEHRIRGLRLGQLKDFEHSIKRHVLKWNSLKTHDGQLRNKARVLSRLFNVQWSEVKNRVWLDAERKAALERPSIDHLLRPEDKGPTDDGIYYHGEDEEAADNQLSDQDWFRKHTEADLYASQ